MTQEDLIHHTGLSGESVVIAEKAEPQSSSLHTTSAWSLSHLKSQSATDLHSPSYFNSSVPAQRLFSPTNLKSVGSEQKQKNH